MSAGPGIGYWHGRSTCTWCAEGARSRFEVARPRLIDIEWKMPALEESVCPGCGLRLPASYTTAYDGFFNTSPECWQAYTAVLGTEFGDAWLFRQAHQLTVDTYAVQHGGAEHPDKSVGIHLAGLCLVLEKSFTPPSVPRLLQRLATAVRAWPRFAPPDGGGLPTVRDIARARSPEDHIERVLSWSRSVWRAWSSYHITVAELVRRYLSVS